MLAMAVVALLFGWRRSAEQAQRRIAQLEKRAQYDKIDAEWDASRLRRHAERTSSPPGGLLSRADLTGAELSGATLAGKAFAFQMTVFTNARLANAELSGEYCAFASARFYEADLRGARLTGGALAFQNASFVDADLSGAVLTGGGDAFKGATLQGARLVGARVACSGPAFHDVDIDGVDFRAADLSTVDAASLRSCYFATPPVYDRGTKFPAGFNPIAEGWAAAATISNE
jgi:hypothetical protein